MNTINENNGSITDDDGKLLIDLVLVVLDASSKDLAVSYSVINDTLIPCLGENNTQRILIALNQSDMAMKGRHWDNEKNLPDPTLKGFLTKKANSVKKIADEYGISTKSVSRDIGRVKDFLAENRDLTGNAELEYCYVHKAYRLVSDEFLADKELFAVAKSLLGTRALSKADTARIIAKFKKFTTTDDRKKLNEIVTKELIHYCEVKHCCEDVTENLWQLVNVIHENREITISYYKMDKTYSEKRIQPVSLIFMEYYFYLIAFYPDRYNEPRYFRVDRINGIVEHRQTFNTAEIPDFDEGLLRKRCQFMFYGKLRTIRFEYTGPSLQAVFDRLPTAKVIGRSRNTHIIEAEVHGDGIKMFLLSQGAWVKVISPADFSEEMKMEIDGMRRLYEPPD